MKIGSRSLVWWYIPVIPALGRLRKEDEEFESSLGYIVRPALAKERKRKLEVGLPVPGLRLPLPSHPALRSPSLWHCLHGLFRFSACPTDAVLGLWDMNGDSSLT
jgi:hypothetical protein